MTYTRRKVITAAGSLPLFGLAGCGSNGSSDGSTNGGGGGSSGSSDPTATETNETAATDTATSTPFASPVARDTAAAYTEALWFTTRYSTAMFEYRSHVQELRTMVADAREAGDFTAEDVEAIRSRASTFYDYLQTQLAPHFTEVEDIITNTDHYVGELEKYRNRDDESGLDSAMASFIRYYDGLGRDSFVQDRFSGRPIRNPLYGYLRAGGLDSNNPVFVIGNPDEPSVRPCRLSSSWNFDLLAETDMGTDAMGVYLDRLELLFSGIDVPSGRTGRVFVESHTANGPRRLRPIYIQHYGDGATAEAALSTALETATSEGTTDSFGRPTWHRVFYTESVRMKFRDEGFAIFDVDDEIVYGPNGAIVPDTSRRSIFDKARILRDQEPERNLYTYFARVGRHLVAASPSTLAWGERPTGAENAIMNTWLWE